MMNFLCLENIVIQFIEEIHNYKIFSYPILG